MPKASILIVEDEAIVAEDLSQKLVRLGYKVNAITACGEEAVALARERRPDLVLMDIRLKGPMDGVQAADVIRQECDIAVIYLTAHSDPATLQRAKLTEPFGYILKPFEELELETHIQMALYKHQAEQKLREQREWLQVTLQSIGDAVLTTDAAGKVTSLNPVAEELTGWKMAEALGRPLAEVFDIINEESRKPAPNPVERVLKEGKIVGLANHTALISRDGMERAIEDSAAPIQDAQGRIVGVVMVFHDATERRRAEEALQQSEKRYRSLFEHMLDGFAYCRVIYENGAPSDFIYLEVNDAFEQLTGLKDVVGKRVSEVIPGIHQSNPELLQTYGRVAQTGRPARFETYLESLGFWFSISVYSPETDHFVAVFHNITERKQAEANRVLLTDVLRTLNRGGDLHAVVREVLGLIRDAAGFDAVGLRLRQGEDCPYYEQSGFSNDFLHEENFLCAKGPNAAIIRDAEGRAVLECTCGLVLSGRADPKMSCFTGGGSFWTNVSSELLALAPKDDPRDNPRNRCIHSGYQSVGLFPVRAGQEIVGLLQLNDRREGRFTPELLAFYENLAQNIGLALQRMAAEETARAVSTELRRTLNTAATGLNRCSRDLRYLSANPAYARLVGVPLEQVVGRPMVDVIGEAAVEVIRPHVERVLRGELEEYEAEVPFAAAGPKYVHVAYTPDEDNNGNVVGWVASVTDITERKRAEARLAPAVRVAGLGIFEHDHRSDLIEYSPLMRELMGFGKDEEVTIEAILGHVVPEDRQALAAAIRRAHDPAGNGLFEVEYRVARPDGVIRWVNARSQTFFEGEPSGRRPVRTVGVAMDITERKEFQAELERLVAERTAKLQELVGELEHFSYTITHDMRAPLRAMQGFASMMTETCAECQEQQPKDFLRRIGTAAGRMDALIMDALNYSRTVRQELPLEPVDAGRLLRGMLDTYPELQPSKAQIEIAGDIPLVMGNEAGLTQCFSNLLGNAVKFAKPGQKPAIRIRAEPREGWVRIWVEDDGIGIAGPLLPRVFDMFSRGHTKYEGTGIGLALVRKVMDRMGGKAGVESEEGKGSRFWLDLKPGDVRSGR